ncbi:MAG: SGNH/GDSL hydrolase family protein [Nitrospiria bacterium]
MKKKLFLSLFLLINSSLAFADEGYSQVVSFGDSLSDNGNLYQLIDSQTPFIPNDGQPPLPYFFGRFSNGPTAVEILAENLKLPLQDYAVGGAKTGPDLTPPPAGPNDNEDPRLNGTGLLAQVDKATQQHSQLSSDALYVVWAGPNDFLASGGSGFANPNTAPHAVDNIAKAIIELNLHGARQFLIPLMPDLGLTPELLSQGSQVSYLGTSQTNYFNQLLNAKIRVISGSLNHVHILIFDTTSLLRDIVNNPSVFGFKNVTNACLDDPGCVLTSFNSGPANNYLFWDHIHPTALSHQLIGKRFFDLVAPAEDYKDNGKTEEFHDWDDFKISGYKSSSHSK